MSISQEIIRLQQAKSDIKTAIEGKGVSVPETDRLDDFPQRIHAITGGGGVSLADLLDSSAKFKGDIVLPDGLTSIGAYAFYYCFYLTSINIPQGVTSIETYAFYYCTSLTSINIPQGVTRIEGNSFRYCSKVTEVIIGEGITGLGGAYIFANMTSLEAITFPDSCTAIRDNTFNSSKAGFTLSVKEGTTVAMTGMPANVNIIYRP